MQTFYVDRPGLLHRLNPLTKLIGTLALVAFAFLVPWYPLPTLLFLLVILPLSVLGRVPGELLRTVGRVFLVAGVALIVLQTLFYPYGETVLFRLWFLEATLEGLRRGYLLASRLAVLVGGFILLLLTTHPGILMSDLARRGLPAALAFVVTSTFQIVPQIEARASRIIDAQRARGLETEGAPQKRLRALLPLVAPLVFGSLAEVEERAIAIEARGFTTPGPRTTIQDIPDSRAEQIARWLLLALILIGIAVRLWLWFG